MFTILALSLISRVSASQGYAYQYANSACTGNPVAGSTYPIGTCYQNEIFECTGNHVVITQYAVGCSGPIVEVMNYTLNSCMNNTKFFCSGTFSVPSNVMLESVYQTSACSSALQKGFQKLDTCIWDSGSTGSTYITYNQTAKTFENLSYDTDNCTGSQSGNYTVPVGTTSSQITSSATSVSGQVFVYQYANSQCTGNPIQGQAAAPGQCFNGQQKAQCVGNQAILWAYTGQQCTGNSFPQLNLTSGTCTGGLQGYCSGTFNIPSGAYVQATTANTQCQTPLYTTFQVLNTCVLDLLGGLGTSQWITYNQSSQSTVTEKYSSQNCTGSSTPSTSGGVGLAGDQSYSSSSSPSTIAFSRLIFITTIALSAFTIKLN